MISLDSKIEYINTIIGKDLDNKFLCDSIVRIVQHNSTHRKEQLNADKDTNEIVFDDRYDYYIYHRLTGISSEERKSGGKRRAYRHNASIELYVYTKHREYITCLIDRLASIREVRHINTDFDSYSIIRNETSKIDFNPAEYIYMIRYELQYNSLQCAEIGEC